MVNLGVVIFGYFKLSNSRNKQIFGYLRLLAREMMHLQERNCNFYHPFAEKEL